jgi:hypothetical protein
MYRNEIAVAKSVHVLHGRHTQQIMFVCPVLTDPALFLPEFIQPEQDRLYHVTIGSIELTDKNAELYPHLSVASESSKYSVLMSEKLVIEPFKPVSY